MEYVLAAAHTARYSSSEEMYAPAASNSWRFFVRRARV